VEAVAFEDGYILGKILSTSRYFIGVTHTHMKLPVYIVVI